MRNVKDKFDGGTVVMLETKGKSAIQLLALSSNTIHWPAHAHTKRSTPSGRGNSDEQAGMLRKKTWETRGVCESYLGVKCPSMRPFR
jgi:hypothetical protein